MITKWKTGKWKTGIEVLECTRETALTVWYLQKSHFQGGASKERKLSKTGDYEQVHDTWEAARAYLLEKANSRLTAARLELMKAQGELGNVMGMKPPKVESAATAQGE